MSRCPQLVERSPDKAVYCSCRCDGPDENMQYCDCPSGYVCEKLVDAFETHSGESSSVPTASKDERR